MRIRSLMGLAVAFGAALSTGVAAKADTVSFVTSGIFTGGDTPNTSTYTDIANGIVIDFISSTGNSANVPPTSQASFGTFDTSGTSATVLAAIAGSFQLTITQTDPTVGNLIFNGTLGGSLATNNSSAFVQFATPLTQSLGSIFYQIASSDDLTAGKVNLAPQTTNGGVASITGRVGAAAVPEPASLALLAMGGSSLLTLARRRRAGV